MSYYFHHQNDTREVLVQTGVIGICGRWPLAAPFLFGSRLALWGGGGIKKDGEK
jgi:hypothetical protein